MAFNINEFKSNGMVLGGARPNQFKVMVFPPPSITSSNSQRIQFFVQAASLPASIMEKVEVPYFGRRIPFAGDRVFQDWQVQVQNDEDFPVRAILEKWSNQMNAHISNRMDTSLYPTGYKQVAEVIQYGKAGNEIRSYKFSGLFPGPIDPIPLDWGQNNTIEVFGCTFYYDYWEPLIQGSSDTYEATLPDDGISGTTPTSG